MSNAILVRPEAEADISEAFRWYEDRSQGLGFEFRRAVHVCVLSLRRNPLAFPAVYGQIRRALLRRFPYGIFYMKRLIRFSIPAIFLISAQVHAPTISTSSQEQRGQAGSAHEGPCWQEARTQLAMNGCAAQDLREADAELNRTYEQVLSKCKDQPDKLARIREAERAWIVFRDAEAEALFPESLRSQFGSVFGMCRAIQLARLTSERTEQLKALVRYKEGDVCSQP